jgi:hypothetical protein
MDETHKFDFAVYEFSFETCRHACQAFILILATNGLSNGSLSKKRKRVGGVIILR